MTRRTVVGLQAALLAALAFWIYWPALHGGWIWDDQVEVADNALLREPGGLAKIWFAPPTTDYFPLKSTVQWLEWHLWGPHVPGYHLTNVVLNLIAAFLLWKLLARFGVRQAFAGASLFVVHPLAVESVAWIAELKNTLSLPPLLIAALAYVAFDRTRRRGAYALALAAFAAALLCKTSVVMFPALLLLYAWWRRGRIGRAEVAASAPFFAVALAMGLVTIWFQQQRALSGAPVQLGGIGARLAAAGLAVAFYLEKCLAPVALMPVYPRWALSPPPPAAYLPLLILAGLLAWFWRRRAGWGRHALFFLAAFVLQLAPVLGFVPMAFLRLSRVSDHLAFLALVVFAAGAGALFSFGVQRLGRRAPVLWGAGAVVLVLLAWQSRGYAAAYRSDESFWSLAVARNPRAWIAQNDLGQALAKDGRLPEAIGHYRAALAEKPDYDAAYVNLGNAWVQSGHPAEAIAAYRRALALKPAYADAHVYLGFALAATGRLPEAEQEYREALRLKPDEERALVYLGTALAQMGRAEEARESFAAALRLDGQDAEAHYDLANVLGNAGRVPEALAEYREALRVNPRYPEAHANLGLALVETGRPQEGAAEIGEALRLRPDYPEAEAYLGFADAKLGRWADAIAWDRRALARDPANPDLHYNLAEALRGAGRDGEAAAELQTAERLSHR